MAQNPFNKGTDHCIWHIQGVQEKLCFFSQLTATPPSPTSLLETFKALNAMQVYSHSYLLVIFVHPYMANFREFLEKQNIS